MLWELLPGAREARNQLVIGYVWLAAGALLFGLPDVHDDSRVDEIGDAIGPVGVGVALSFAAFMLGSFIDDAIGAALPVRRARPLTLSPREVRAFSSGSWLRRMRLAVARALGAVFGGLARPDLTARDYAEDSQPLDVLANMNDRELQELERFEAAIDRLSAEVTLRFALLLPLVTTTTFGWGAGSYWALAPGSALLAFLWQISMRTPELRQNLRNSEAIRERAANRLGTRPS